jgi:hypothetical protein
MIRRRVQPVRTANACVPVALLLATVLPIAGCFSYHPSNTPTRPSEPLAADAWPRFDTDPLEALAATPASVPRFVIDRDRVAGSLKSAGDARIDETVADLESRTAYHVRLVRRTDHGLLRFWTDPRDNGRVTRKPFFSWNGRLEEFVRNGAFLTAPALAAGDAREQSRKDHGLEEDARAGVGPFGLRRTGEPQRWRLDEGIGLSVPSEVAPDAPGLIVHLTSLLENKYEHGVLNRFRGWGWAVAHIESRIGVPGPNETARIRRRDLQRQRVRALMDEAYPDPPVSLKEHIARDTLLHLVTEQVEAEFPDLDTGFEIRPGTDIAALGATIARAVDARLAEHAYAAEALVAAIDEANPQLATRPLVVFGFSGGALAAPAVAARLHEAFPGRPLRLVLVGGGGDILTIARTSTLTDGGVTLVPKDGPEPTGAQLAELQRAYEEASRLDPLRAAAALRDVPILHISADADTVVPTPAARRFDQTHAGVDRIEHRGSHNTLFFFLNSQAGKIRSWLRAHGAE